MQPGALFNSSGEPDTEQSWRAGCGVKLVSWVRSKVGELGRLYAPRQAPSGRIGGLRWCSLHLGARPPSDTENNGQAPPRGNGAACAGAFSTPARELGTPHGGTVHPTAARYTPRRHGTPTAARYTPRRHTPRRRTGKAIPTRRAGGRPKGERAAMVFLHKYAITRALN